MNNRLLAATVLGTTLILGQASALAGKEFYKWKDENGVTHYSATPPPKSEASEADKIRTTHLNPDAPAPQPEAERAEAEESKKDMDGDIMPGKSKEACQQAKDALKMIEEHPRLRFKDSNTGEIRYMTQEEIQEQKSRAQKQVKANC